MYAYLMFINGACVDFMEILRVFRGSPAYYSLKVKLKPENK